MHYRNQFFHFGYIFFCPPFFCQSEEKFVTCSRDREEGKYPDSQLFHFDESPKSIQRILLLAFGLSLLFFHRTSFTKHFKEMSG